MTILDQEENCKIDALLSCCFLFSAWDMLLVFPICFSLVEIIALGYLCRSFDLCFL